MLFHQVATAVNGATENSLVIVDEFGKGTATVLLNSVISNMIALIYIMSATVHFFLVFSWLDRWPVLIDRHTPSLV